MMQQDFETIARWIEQHHPDKIPQFNQPASDEQIAAFENRVGLKLPPSVRTLYRLANGQPLQAVCLHGSFLLMSLDEVVEEINFLDEEFPEGINTYASDDASIDADPGIKPVWWSRLWIPIMQNGGGDHLCVDLDPAKGGNIGQVVAYYHDEMFRALVSSGIDGFLQDLAGRILSGKCRIEDGMLEDA